MLRPALRAGSPGSKRWIDEALGVSAVATHNLFYGGRTVAKKKAAKKPAKKAAKKKKK
jgi:hypothetical protein